MFKHTYNPKTGEFTNKFGRVVGANQKSEYSRVWHRGKSTYAHRLAFLHMGVEIPEGKHIDHINGDKHDNRWENLRIATVSENHHNKKVRENSKSGVTGVTWNKGLGKWEVKIMINRKNKYLGIFEDFLLAVATRYSAEEELNPSGLCQAS